MGQFKKTLVELQEGAYLASSKHESPELAKRFNFMRFTVLLFQYYASFLLIILGIIVKIGGPLHLNQFESYFLSSGIGYILYRLFIKSSIIKDFDNISSDGESSRKIRMYYFFLAGSFCSFIGAFILLIQLYNK